jgi:hypothetical protein
MNVTLEELSAREDFSELVEAEVQKLAGFWGAGARDLNLHPGSPLRDLLITPAAEAEVLGAVREERCRRSSSLYELSLDPALADPDAVDRILANHPTLKRRADGPARGQIALYMESDTITVVPAGSTFARDGLNYRTGETWICTPGTLTAANNRPLTPLADGTWVFTVPVEAESPGEQYNLKAGVELEWVDTATRVVRILADTDFYGGVDPESNAELLARLDSGLAAPGDAGRMNLQALILREFPFVTDISLIGGGDPEMLRDGRNLLGLKVGGKTDAHVRTAREAAVRKFPLQADLIDPGEGLLQLYVGRDVYPGFYALAGVRRTDQTDLDPALEVTEQIYSADVGNLPYDPPEVREEADFRFTRFQALLIRFRDPDYDPDHPDYLVSLLGLPGIGDIQDYLSRRDVRSPNNDLLVKAPVPCLVSVNATVEYAEAGAAVDWAACREAAAAAVGLTRFERGKLSTSGIIQAVQNLLPGTAQLRPPVDLLGTTILPGGGIETRRTSTELAPETREGVSSRTVSYFVADVAITPRPVVRLQV